MAKAASMSEFAKQLRIAARARELVDHGTLVEAACRIVILEDQLEEAQRINADYRAESRTRRPHPATARTATPAASSPPPGRGASGRWHHGGSPGTDRQEE